MHFGIFMEFGFRGEGAEAEAFREGLALAEAAEAWGLDSVWLSEFHFSPERSVLSSPMLTAAWIAARTSRVRIGLAVYVLPLAHPLRVAEEVATLDQLSGGRFEFGVGRSGFVRSYNSFAIPYGESGERFEESLAILREAWKGGKFSYQGRYYQVADALVVPQPVQRPHPPMRMAATSPTTFEKVARQGLPIFVGFRGDGLAELKQCLQHYRNVWAENGHAGGASAYLRVPVYAAQTEALALETPRDNIVYYFERQARLLARQGAQREAGNTSREEVAKGLSALSYEDILESRVVFGTPNQIIERVRAWQETLGIDGIIMELNAGGRLSERQVLDSLKLVTDEVMPAFR